MMVELLVGLAVALLGTAIVATSSRRMPVLAAACLAVLAGTAGYVLSSLVLVLFGAFSTVAALSLALVSAIIAMLLTAKAVAIPRLGLVAATTAGMTTLVVVVTNLVTLPQASNDTVDYLTTAAVLERLGDLSTITSIQLLKRQLGAPLLQTVGSLTGNGYGNFLVPLIGLATLGLTAWFLHGVLVRVGLNPKHRRRVVVSSVVFLLVSNRFLHGLFYINGHMLFAGLLLGAVSLCWFALEDRSPSNIAVAGLFLAALVPLRAEAVMVAIVFLIPILVSGIDQRARWVLIGPFVAASIVWYGLVLPSYVDSSDLTLTGPVFANLIGAAMLTALVAALGVPTWHKYHRWLPWMVGGGVIGFVALAAVSDSYLVTRTLSMTARNIVHFGLWGSLVLVLAILVGLSMWAVRLPNQGVWVYALPTYAALVIALAYIRDAPYRLGWGDSGNRMWLHVIPIAVVAVFAAFGEATVRAGAPTTLSSEETRSEGHD